LPSTKWNVPPWPFTCPGRALQLGEAKAEVPLASARGALMSAQAALQRLKPFERSIRAALADGVSLRRAAELLKERSISSPADGRWHAPSLLKAA